MSHCSLQLHMTLAETPQVSSLPPPPIRWHRTAVTDHVRPAAQRPEVLVRVTAGADQSRMTAGQRALRRRLRGVLVWRVSADRLGHRVQDLAGFGHGGVVGVHVDPSDDAVGVGDDDGGHGQCGALVRVDLGQVQA